MTAVLLYTLPTWVWIVTGWMLLAAFVWAFFHGASQLERDDVQQSWLLDESDVARVLRLMEEQGKADDAAYMGKPRW